MHIYQKLPTEYAASSAIALAKSSVVLQEDAIMILISSCDDPITAASEVIRFLITRKHKQSAINNPVFYDVSIARKIGAIHTITDKALAADLIAKLAEQGLRADLVGMTKQFLDRNPTDDELIALTKSYCKDNRPDPRAESELLEMALRFGTPETRKSVMQMIHDRKNSGQCALH